MFTSSTEWMVAGGSNEDYLTPTNPIARPQTRRGSYFLPPLLVGDVIVCTARGGVVRDFAYSFEDDTFNGPDRTILARHLFEHRKIVSWCYAQSPYSIVWAVLDDGTLLSLTYLREHDVWGWTPHETSGTVESVISLPEGDEDAVYITVKRTVRRGRLQVPRTYGFAAGDGHGRLVLRGLWLALYRRPWSRLSQVFTTLTVWRFRYWLTAMNWKG